MRGNTDLYGITAAIVGLYRQVVPLHLAFASTCLLSAGFSLGIASYYVADSVGGGVGALRWGSAAAITPPRGAGANGKHLIKLNK